MPLQSLLIAEAQRRIHRVAHREDAAAQRLVTYFVGQVVGQMNEPKSTRRVVQEMVAEFVAAMDRLNGLVGDE
jgi:hypothetical protein